MQLTETINHTMLDKSLCAVAPPRQQGSTLLISLVLMTLITLLGLSTMKTALTGEKIAGHIQDLHLATESAESALRRGQRQIRIEGGGSLSSGVLHKTKKTSQTVAPDEAPDLTDWTSDPRILWVTDAEMEISANDDAEDVTPLPRPSYKLELFDYKIENLGTGDSTPYELKLEQSPQFYRVFGRGVGRSGENEVILQSLLTKGLK